jgi:hypothetical protein
VELRHAGKHAIIHRKVAIMTDYPAQNVSNAEAEIPCLMHGKMFYSQIYCSINLSLSGGFHLLRILT